MEGIDYIIDEKGVKKALILNLEEYGEYIEDIEDVLIAYKRIKEPRIPLEKVKENLRKKGVIDV